MQGKSPQFSNVQIPQTLGQNVMQTQTPATSTPTYQQSPVVPHQQSPLLQPSVLAPQQNQPQFVQPRVTQPMGPIRQPSPSKQSINPTAKSFIPVAVAQPEAVPSTPKRKIPKSNGGQGVKIVHQLRRYASDVNSLDI